jgi:CO/xanthine dehydrogenase Mo-binding subunit
MVKFAIGDSVRRVEDQDLITGRGRYVDDINLPRQCYGLMVHSPHAHARILGIISSRPTSAAFTTTIFGCNGFRYTHDNYPEYM